MRLRFSIVAMVMPVLVSCAGSPVGTPTAGLEGERHRPRNSAERLALEAAESRRDITRGGWTAHVAGSEGARLHVTLTRPTGEAENAPLEVYDLALRDGWVEQVGEPRYLAPSDDLEQGVLHVAREAAGAPSGQAIVAVKGGALVGRKTDLRCLVEVRALSTERRELFSRTVNVCP
ncbi:hypothetical protein [Geobacter pickeringii]|uniref:Lipoprotein n=1 Tax=Geobacter pickeringii TaxID=345632 RepID=A0A0B5B7T4_9BACT|nr:hypothetical protein [Geobacter pickeringii]AJE02598.1 hypothetical protein GPICK_03700 [Geobacter pickeringii]